MREVIEFVRVEDSVFNLSDELNHGCLYFAERMMANNFKKITNEKELMRELIAGNVYREINRVATWEDLAIELIDGGKLGGAKLTKEVLVNLIRNHPEFAIEISHLISGMTNKQEVE